MSLLSSPQHIFSGNSEALTCCYVKTCSLPDINQRSCMKYDKLMALHKLCDNITVGKCYPIEATLETGCGFNLATGQLHSIDCGLIHMINWDKTHMGTSLTYAEV